MDAALAILERRSDTSLDLMQSYRFRCSSTYRQEDLD